MKKYLLLILAVLVLSMFPVSVKALPFVPTSSPTTKPVHWYYLKVNNSKYVYQDIDFTGMSDSDISVSSSYSNEDKYLWCFVGNASSGYKIYNRSVQSYLCYGNLFNNSDEFSADYCEVGSGNNFYIYFKFTPWGSSDIYKNYLCYSNGEGFYTTMGKENTYYTVVEAFVEEEVQVTEQPVIDVDIHETECIISATGAGEVRLYVNDSRVENPCSIERTAQDQSVMVTATAQESGKEMSSVTTQLVIPALETPGPDPQDGITLTPYSFNIPNNELGNYDSEGFAKLFDKDKSTKWCVVNSSGEWQTIWVDFTSNKPLIPSGYILTTGNDTYRYSGRNPKKWRIYAKVNNNDLWTPIVEVEDGEAAGLGQSNTTDYSFNINGVNTKYQYFRFEVSEIRGKDGWNSSNYVFQLAEFQFIEKTAATVTGDVDGSGMVDVDDVNALINIILQLKPASAYPGNADLTGDGIVDVDDVNALINIILGQE